MGLFKDGEYMNLVWDGSPDAYYIRGHVNTQDGLSTLIDEGAIDDVSEVGDSVQKFGRWSVDGDRPDGCTQTLRTYLTPGRGRFKITEFGVGIFAKKPQS